MNETTSAVEDFDELKLTEEEDAEGAVIVELDLPDDVEASELEDAITRALKAADGDSDVVFSDAAEFLAVERLESEGIWAECPFIPGHAILVRRGAFARDKYSKLERKYRIEHKQVEGELSISVQEGLMRESMFDTVFKDWRGFAPDGQEWPFDLKHYRKLWSKERWKNFAIAQVAKLGGDDSPALEAIRGN